MPGLSRWPSPTRSWALLVSLLYAGVSATYIALSDVLAARLVHDPARLTFVQTIKGWCFIALTSVLLYLLVSKAIERVSRLQRARSQSDERFRRMIESTGEGVWIIDEHGVTQYVNQTMARMLGAAVSELIGQRQSAFMDDPWKSVARAKLAECRRGTAGRYDFQFRRVDGSALWTIVACTPMINDAGRFTGALMLVTDITHHVQTEHALELHVQVQRRLLSELDHRVRNSLSSILGLVEITRRGAAGIDEFATAIRGRVQAMAKAHDLGSQARRAPLDLYRLIEEVIDPAQRARATLSGPPVAVTGTQAGSLALLVHELITSSARRGALKHPSGSIEIAWESAGQAQQPEALIHITWTERWQPDHSGAAAAGVAPAEVESVPLSLAEGLVRADLRGRIQRADSAGQLRYEIEARLDQAPAGGPAPASAA